MTKRKRSAKQKANDKRLREGKKPIKQKTKRRKTTTRKRRTTRARKGEKTLRGKQAYPKTVRRRAKKKSDPWSF